MEKRTCERITDNLEAEIVIGDISYSGIVMNLSETGLYLVTATIYDVVDISANRALDLNLKLPTGEILPMKCEVKWLRTKNSPFGVTFSMGMEIDDPPREYKNFLNTDH